MPRKRATSLSSGGSRASRNGGGGRPATAWEDPTKRPPKDTRDPDSMGRGTKGVNICPDCGALLNLKRRGNDAVPELGLRASDIIFPNHRPGGGRYSVQRGDALCPGAGKVGN